MVEWQKYKLNSFVFLQLPIQREKTSILKILEHVESRDVISR